MKIRAPGNTGEDTGFSALFRQVQAGRQPMDALLQDPTFEEDLRAIVAARTPNEVVEEVTKAFLSRLGSPPRLESNYVRELESEFDDLLANMQTAKSKRAVRKAFAASPAQLGRAAVKQANKKS